MATANIDSLLDSPIWHGDVSRCPKYKKKTATQWRQYRVRARWGSPVYLLVVRKGRDADTRQWDAVTTEILRMIQIWQERWTEELTGNWTRQLIKDLRPWIERDFRYVNFYVTQLLTGYAHFRQYLYRMANYSHQTANTTDTNGMTQITRSNVTVGQHSNKDCKRPLVPSPRTILSRWCPIQQNDAIGLLYCSICLNIRSPITNVNNRI